MHRNAHIRSSQHNNGACCVTGAYAWSTEGACSTLYECLASRIFTHLNAYAPEIRLDATAVKLECAPAARTMCDLYLCIQHINLSLYNTMLLIISQSNI